MDTKFKLNFFLSAVSTISLCVIAYGMISASLSIKTVESMLASQRVRFWLVMRSSVSQGGNAYLSIPFSSQSSCENAVREIFSNANLAPNDVRIVGYKCIPSELSPSTNKIPDNW